MKLEFCSLSKLIEALPKDGIVICDKKLMTLYPEFVSGLKQFFFVYLLPVHENIKTMDTALAIINFLCKNKAHKKTPLIGIGGGVVGDLCGFVASIYLRSIPLYLVPTTVVSFVDAHIGGKNGVNLVEGKNLIGTINKPTKLYLYPPFISSLPSEEILNGWAEILKTSLITPQLNFDQLCIETPLLFKKDIAIWSKYIRLCIAIKEAIVQRDLLDQGERNLLNFGHTFAHALEAYSKYTVPHGQAVLWGILQESYLSMLYDTLPVNDVSKLNKLYSSLNIHQASHSINIDSFIALMRVDKKNQGTLSSIILKAIGKPYKANYGFLHPITENQVKQCIQWQYHGY